MELKADNQESRSPNKVVKSLFISANQLLSCKQKLKG